MIRSLICPLRIIPAYAGKRIFNPGTVDLKWDHPRIRGEKLSWTVRGVMHSGSSPHTRGKVGQAGLLLPFRRIIPAYAGKSLRRKFFFVMGKDHPRIRGEKCVPTHIQTAHEGSSPHTRGKVRASPRETFQIRIIPAYAGKSEKPGIFTAVKKDHPRIRGEKKSQELENQWM